MSRAIELLGPQGRERFEFHVKRLQLWKPKTQDALAVAILTSEPAEALAVARFEQGANVAMVDRHTVAHVDD